MYNKMPGWELAEGDKGNALTGRRQYVWDLK